MFTIRNATPADLPAIVAIYNSTIPGRMVTADTEPVTAESRLVWLESHTVQRPLWAVILDGELVAWISFKPFYGRPAYEATVEIAIYIQEQQRAKGLGQQLLQYVIQQSPQLGIRTLLGFIFGQNRPSLKLFEKNGFEKWGLLPGVARIDGSDHDLVIMGLRLPGESVL